MRRVQALQNKLIVSRSSCGRWPETLWPCLSLVSSTTFWTLIHFSVRLVHGTPETPAVWTARCCLSSGSNGIIYDHMMAEKSNPDDPAASKPFFELLNSSRVDLMKINTAVVVGVKHETSSHFSFHWWWFYRKAVCSFREVCSPLSARLRAHWRGVLPPMQNRSVAVPFTGEHSWSLLFLFFFNMHVYCLHVCWTIQARCWKCAHIQSPLVSVASPSTPAVGLMSAWKRSIIRRGSSGLFHQWNLLFWNVSLLNRATLVLQCRAAVVSSSSVVFIGRYCCGQQTSRQQKILKAVRLFRKAFTFLFCFSINLAFVRFKDGLAHLQKSNSSTWCTDVNMKASVVSIYGVGYVHVL